MTTRLTPAHESFCRHFVASNNAAEAARVAGFSEAYGNRQGWRLMRRPAILRRIAELRAELAERECLNPPALFAKLETAYRSALAKGQPAAAARIVETQAKLAGLLAKAAGGAGAGAGGAGEADTAAHAETRAALAAMAKQLGLPTPAFAAESGRPAGDKR